MGLGYTEEKQRWWERVETRGVVLCDFSWEDVSKCLFVSWTTDQGNDSMKNQFSETMSLLECLTSA